VDRETMNDAHSDRRLSTRYDVITEVGLTSSAGRTTVQTRDLSKGGLCLLLPAPLPRNEIVKIELSLLLGPNAQSEPLVLSARIAWCAQETQEQFQVGVSFANLTEDHQVHIETFLEFLRQGFEVSGDQVE